MACTGHQWQRTASESTMRGWQKCGGFAGASAKHKVRLSGLARTNPVRRQAPPEPWWQVALEVVLVVSWVGAQLGQ